MNNFTATVMKLAQASIAVFIKKVRLFRFLERGHKISLHLHFFYLGLKVNILEFIYGKSNTTIYTWIHNWDEYILSAPKCGSVDPQKFNIANKRFI